MTASPVELTDIESLAGLFPAFEFERLIARGRMGAVYKARQRSLDRDVAIRILPPELGVDPHFRTPFQAETRAMARLNHPNLVKVFDTGEVDGCFYSIMEYVPGKSLFHASQGIAIDPLQAVEIIMGVCRGLAHAHEVGVIHGNLTPGNILLTLQCEPKVGDFGLGLGNSPSMAPGCAHRGEGDIASDVHAVGAVLRELLTGVPAGAENAVSRMPANPTLAAICTRATHADPALRFPDAASLEESLRQWKASKDCKPVLVSKPLQLSKPLLTPQRHAARPGGAGLVRPLAGVPAKQSRPGSWPLLKNCAIIAFLLCSIHFTWGIYQKGNEEIARENRKPALKQKSGVLQSPKSPPAPLRESSFETLARMGTEFESAEVPSADSSR